MYVIALICIMLFFSHTMEWYFALFGLIEVIGFFYFTNRLTKQWAQIKSARHFEKTLFLTAWMIRFPVMLFLYWFFNEMTGQPYMFSAADEMGYQEEAEWIAECIDEGKFWTSYWDYKFGKGGGVSDFGYPMWLGVLSYISDNNILFIRTLKTLIGAYTCVIVYRITARNFGGAIGRVAGVIYMLWPELVIYSGMHLKETEMIFLMMLFLNHADKLLRDKKLSIKSILLTFASAIVLFAFRTVMGLTAVMSLLMSFALTSSRLASMGRRWVVIVASLIAIGYFAGGRVAREVETVWEQKDENQAKRLGVQEKTNSFAKYAGAAVFAPMVFTLPYPTMVATEGQENSRLWHGGLFDKNIMSCFCVLGLFLLIISGDWREHILIGAMLIGYLVIIIFSAFGAAQRFHLPAAPMEIMFMSYGMTQTLKNSRYKLWYNIWLILIFVIVIFWQYIKLRGRGL